MKRWTDVVIEFKENEKKRERRELALLNGEDVEDEEPYNPLDYAPMYSSFTRDMTFVEPVYGIIQSTKDEDEWPDIALRPLNRTASGRKLTMMEKTQRMRRFREHMRTKRLEEERQKMDSRDALQLKRSSSFHSGLSTPARSINRIDRPQSALDLSQGNQRWYNQYPSSCIFSGCSGWFCARRRQKYGNDRKETTSTICSCYGMRKSTSALDSSTQHSRDSIYEIFWAELANRPGTGTFDEKRWR